MGCNFSLFIYFVRTEERNKKNLKDHLSSLHCVLDSSIYVYRRERTCCWASSSSRGSSQSARATMGRSSFFSPFFFSARRVGFAKHAYKIYIEEHDAYIHTWKNQVYKSLYILCVINHHFVFMLIGLSLNRKEGFILSPGRLSYL